MIPPPPPEPPPPPRHETGVLSDYRGHKALADLIAGELWLALHTGDPGALGSPDTEIAGGDYTRRQVSFHLPTGQKTMTNTGGPIIFSGLVPVGVFWMAVWTAQVGGSMLFTLRMVDDQGAPRPITLGNEGDQIHVTDGDLSITL